MQQMWIPKERMSSKHTGLIQLISPLSPFSFEGHRIVGSSWLSFQAKHTHSLQMQTKGFSEKRQKVAFFYWPEPAALFCRNAMSYMLLSGNKTSLTAKTSSYPFLCLVSSVGRGGWRAEVLGQPPHVFCPTTTLRNFRKPSRITSA